MNAIGVINNPNALGTLCNYSFSAVSLGTVAVNTTTVLAHCNYGLPNFISNYFEQKPVIPPLTGTITCGNAGFTAPVLNAFAGYSITSQKWDFGDSLSGASNTSTLSNPNHIFSSNGTYTVKLILNYNCTADTLIKVVTVDGLPQLTLTQVPKICAGEKVTLNFSGASAYSLNTVAVNQSSTVVQPAATSIYTVTGTDSNGCRSSKALKVNVALCAGVTQLSAERFGILITPNPNHGIFEITLQGSTKVTITDVSGRQVKMVQLEEGRHEIDLSNNANGFYFLFAENERGRQTVKIVKE